MGTEKVLFSWSGGKDSTMALYEIQKSQRYEVVALLTTVTRNYDRVSMHGLRITLLEAQASSLGFTLEKIFISKNASNNEYESKMEEILLKYTRQGVSSVVFGDIFLEDLRKYREDNLAKVGMKGVFPVWKKDTAGLAHEFIDSGFKAVIICVDSNALDGKFAGNIFDKKFLSELPRTVDPCGENGEFHTFVYDGPIFKESILYTVGDVVLRDSRFYYCDLLPVK
ncbi:MAG TPA: diphthine--ammonia ligase [Thermodesulfobacteriota bacterium]|nr:diphthine--ammonia ligase [Thermodesulfobacteriota bacterium]